MAQKHNNEYYHARWKRIVNVMQNNNMSLSRIAPAGSRAKKQHRLDSDFDVIFAISKNPTRQNFYPKLIEVLKANFKNDNVYLGKNYNVVHLDFQSGAKFDIVLLTDSEFDKEYESLKDFKREHL